MSAIRSIYRKNVGTLDRLVRFALGAALIPLGLFALDGLHGRLFGVLAIALGGAAFATALTGRCPGYVPFGIDTRRIPDGAEPADERVGSARQRGPASVRGH